MPIQITLKQGDCLNLLPLLPDKSIDAVICDLPYGSTACAWDTIIPFEPMWKELKRITKDRAAIALFSSQPFTSILVTSNLEMFRYEWIWDKVFGTNFLNAKNRPLKQHENIVVFSKGVTANGGKTKMQYFPQMWMSTPYRKTLAKDPRRGAWDVGKRTPFQLDDIVSNGERYPLSIIRESNANRFDKIHPTQKPVALMEYLIRTYTNEGDTILDFTMGSGTTGVACARANRNFIGFELDEKYFAIAQKRINEELEKPVTKPLFSDDSHVNKDISHASEPLAA